MQPDGRTSGTRIQDGVDRHLARGLLDRCGGEFREMPGLCLSRAQAARLWGLSTQRCATVLEALVAQGDLTFTRDGRYVATSRLSTPWRPFVVGDDRTRGAA